MSTFPAVIEKAIANYSAYSPDLPLELPEQVYEALMKAAKRQGQHPEAVAVQWLATASESQIDDPFEQFIGAFSSNVPDWGDRHDEYISQGLAISHS